MGYLSLLRTHLDSLHEGAMLACSGALPSVARAMRRPQGAADAGDNRERVRVT
jgi:hypothetical protein